jgi:hypothetical protein
MNAATTCLFSIQFSLTPRFSEVPRGSDEATTASAVYPSPKNVKAVASVASRFNTPLKQGVNEILSIRAYTHAVAEGR